MAGWDDLVTNGQPAIVGGGVDIVGLAEGCTWYLELEIVDASGTPVPWTGVTGQGHIYDKPRGGTVLVDWTISLPTAGRLVARVEKADTVGLATEGAAHGIFLTKGAERVAVCLPFNSLCPIRSED